MEQITSRRTCSFYKDKNIHLDLERAKFISQVFYERDNQLKFNELLRNIELESKKKTSDEERKKASEYKRQVIDERLKFLKYQNNLRNEINSSLLRSFTEKRSNQKKELEEEKKCIQNWEQELQNIENKQRNEIFSKKNYVRKLNEENITTKRKQLELDKLIEMEETKIRNVYNTLADLVNEEKDRSIKISMKQIKEYKENVASKYFNDRRSSLSQLSETIPSVINNLSNVLEEISKKKRESEKFSGETVDTGKQKKSFDEKLHKESKHLENYQRLNNQKVTERLARRINKEKLEKCLKYRHQWNENIVAKSQQKMISQNNDREAMKKVKSNYENENNDFLQTANNIIEECLKTGKPTFPVIKSIRAFKRQNYLIPVNLRKEVYFSQIPIGKR